MDDGRWRERPRLQAGMLSVRQCNDLAVPRAVVRHKLSSGRWVQHTEHVVSTTTGELSGPQLQCLGVLHAGGDAVVGGTSAAVHAGMRGWEREHVTVLVSHERSLDPVPGIDFVRTRRPLRDLRGTRPGLLPGCRVEPAALLFAASEPSVRTAQGILAAVIQQRLTTPDAPAAAARRAAPSPGPRRAAPLHRLRVATARRAGGGPPGHGAFHLDALHWEADLRRQRKLTTSTTTVVRCTAVELRDDCAAVAEDLVALGVRRSGV